MGVLPGARALHRCFYGIYTARRSLRMREELGTSAIENITASGLQTITAAAGARFHYFQPRDSRSGTGAVLFGR